MTSASGTSKGRSTFIETCATSPSSSTPIARTPGQAALGALAYRGGDTTRVLQRGGRGELQIEGDERRTSADERGAGRRMDAGRAEVGRERALEQRGNAAAAQLGAAARRTLAVGGELAVEEHGELELLPEAVGHDERLGARSAAVARVEVDERHDVERADVRVLAGVLPATAPGARDDVDLRHGAAAPREQRVGEIARRCPASVNTERW